MKSVQKVSPKPPGKPGQLRRQAVNFDDDSPQLREMEKVTKQGLADRFASEVTTSAGALLEQKPAAAPITSATPAGQRRETFTAVSACQEGLTYEVPLHLVRPNPWGARHFYHAEEVDAIGVSLQDNGQDEPAKGYVDGDHITLIDGGTRLRSARSTGRATLAVTMRKPPADVRELFRESVRMNVERSEHTALDLAVVASRMMEEGHYSTHDDLAADLRTRDGRPMDRASVTRLLRIGKIPEHLLRQMSEHEKTCGLRAAYEVSAFFAREDFAARSDDYAAMAEEVIDEIQKKDLTTQQTISLVTAKLSGPKQRRRSDTWPVTYSNARGQLKVFQDRGEVQFHLRGLNDAELAKVQRQIEEMCKQPPARVGEGP
jgi:ParB family chromosome partitioning protein